MLRYARAARFGNHSRRVLCIQGTGTESLTMIYHSRERSSTPARLSMEGIGSTGYYGPMEWREQTGQPLLTPSPITSTRLTSLAHLSSVRGTIRIQQHQPITIVYQLSSFDNLF